jgi:transmembrane sensor
MSEDAKALQARAVEWLVQRQTAENWNAEEQAALDAWLDESPEHLLAYWRAEDGWNRTELLGALRPFRPAAMRNPDRTRALWVRRAAVVAIFAATGVFALRQFAETPPPSERVYSTVVGEHKTLALADGSQIEMNTDTVLRASKRKVVLLKGEAYFQIKHDAAHPFMVYAAGHRIVDLGTKFLVRSAHNRVEVALVEGAARVDSDGAKGSGHSALLKPGDVAIATANSISVTKKAAPTLAKELAWRHGNLIFDNTALADVAAEFNRYNRQKIVITDPKVARLTIVGTFPANDVEAIINTAREVFGLHTEQKNDRILISR